MNFLKSFILIGIISGICGGDPWNEMENYDRSKEDFLRTFFELPLGVSFHDTSNRVYSNIYSNEIEPYFIEWVYKQDYFIRSEAELSIFSWIETWDNKSRIHSYSGYRTINEFETEIYNQNAAV